MVDDFHKTYPKYFNRIADICASEKTFTEDEILQVVGEPRPLAHKEFAHGVAHLSREDEKDRVPINLMPCATTRANICASRGGREGEAKLDGARQTHIR